MSQAPKAKAVFRVAGASEQPMFRPDGGTLASLSIQTTIYDRYAGTTVTEAIWRDEPNLNVIMRAASLEGVREQCAAFFLTRSIRKVITSLIPVRSIQEGDIIFQPDTLFKAIVAAVPTAGTAQIVMEIVNSFFRRNGMISNNGEFTTEHFYPIEPVTVSRLAEDVAMQEVVKVLGEVKLGNIKDGKYTAETFASAVAEALIPVGRAFLDINEMGNVVEDMKRGVLANITNGFGSGLTGDVPSSWRDNPVIAELSTNYTFVIAALELPKNSSIVPVSEGWSLHQWAPIILAALKSSRRYAIVSLAEVKRNLGKKTIRDLRGKPKCFVMHRSATPAAVAQCVYSFIDASLSSATTIIPMRERIDQAITSAYGNVRGLGTDFAADRFASFMTNAIEGGFNRYKLGYFFEVGSYGEVSDHELVCLSSREIMIELSSTEENWVPGVDRDLKDSDQWWYTIETQEREFDFSLQGRLNGSDFITHNVTEAIMAMADFEPAAPMDARPQMIAPAAFNTRLINFDGENVLIPVTERFAYDVTLNGTRLSGSFKTNELGSLRAAEGTFVVKPRFNAEVFDTTLGLFAAVTSQVTSMRKQLADKDDPFQMSKELVDYLDRQRGLLLLQMSQCLNPAFRAEVHHGIAKRSIMKLGTDEALALSAHLAQRQFGAYADVAAFLLFLTIQGIDIEWSKPILESQEMIRTFMDFGTDRPALSN